MPERLAGKGLTPERDRLEEGTPAPVPLSCVANGSYLEGWLSLFLKAIDLKAFFLVWLCSNTQSI